LGLTRIVISYGTWNLNKVIDLSGEPSSYNLNYTFQVPVNATAGDHTVTITAYNTSDKTAVFSVIVTVTGAASYDNVWAAGGFAWWGWNAEHAYMMLQDPADDKWFEILVHAWDGYNEIKFVGQLAWNPDNWGLIDNTNPSLGMINDENSQGILLDAMSENPAYYKVRFNPTALSYTTEKINPTIAIQDSLFIVGSGFTDYPNLDWNPSEAIPMVRNPSGWGDHIFEIFDLKFSDTVSIKFIGQTTGWNPLDVGFDEDYIVDIDSITNGYQVAEPISWLPTEEGSSTADLKFIGQAGLYTVMYDHFAKRAIIWKQ